METPKLEIAVKGPKGEDGYRTFSIRIRDELCERLERLAGETGRSRNELIGLLLEFGLDHCEIKK